MTSNNPQGWKECKLGDVAEITSSKRIYYSEYVANGVPFFRSKEIIERFNKQNTSTELFIKRERYEEVKSKFGAPQEGDILLTSVGTLGIPYLVRKEDEFYFKDGNLIWFRNIDLRATDRRFLYFWITSVVGQQKFYEASIGSTQPALTIVGIKNIDILLPSLPEQCAIASVLSSLDDKIDLLHRQNKTLEGIAEALWRKMFVEEADPGWKKGKLGYIAEETIGGDWGEDTQSNELIPIICLRGVDLQNIKESGFSSEAPIRFIKPTSLEKRTLQENEILIAGSGIGPIGKSIPINSALLRCYSYPVIYSNFCKRLRTESKEMAYFIEFMIYQFYKEGELDQFHMGTSVPNFNLKDFLNFEVSVPPRDIVSLFSSFLTDWYNKKFTNQIRMLSIFRDTLLPKLMSGEVRVKL
jgi:type I restriction enzyme S subunit